MRCVVKLFERLLARVCNKLYRPAENLNFTYSADIPKDDVVMHISKFGWLVGHEVTCKDDGDFIVIRIKK